MLRTFDTRIKKKNKNTDVAKISVETATKKVQL